MDEGAKFKRYLDRIYLEDLPDGATPRVAFLSAPGESRDWLDPLAEWARGCFVSFPPTQDLAGLLAKALDIFDGNSSQRLLVVSSKGMRRSLVTTKPNGKVDSGEIRFGDPSPEDGEAPTGEQTWHLKLEETTLRVWPDRGLQFDFGRMADFAGFYWGDEFHARAPKDSEWVRFEVYGPRAGLWIAPAIFDHQKLADLGVGSAVFEKTETIEYRKHSYPLFDLGSTEEQFTLELNCADPYHQGAARTRLLLPEKPIRTAFNEANGRSIALVSDSKDPDPGQIILARAPRTIGQGRITSLTHQFLPEGVFKILGMGAKDKALAISLGSSNLETLALSVEEGSATIRFAPGHALVDREKCTFTDDDNFTTAWIAVEAGAVATRPLAIDAEGMQPYAFVTGKSSDGGNMTFRPTRTSQEAKSVPFVPVLALSSGGESLKLDREVLSKARRANLFAQSTAAAAAGGIEELRTPQGYFARRSDAGFAQILFARTQPRQDSAQKRLNPTPVVDFGLVPTTPKGMQLLAEITANSRFFLATKVGKLLKHFEPASLAKFFMGEPQNSEKIVR